MDGRAFPPFLASDVSRSSNAAANCEVVPSTASALSLQVVATNGGRSRTSLRVLVNVYAANDERRVRNDVAVFRHVAAGATSAPVSLPLTQSRAGYTCAVMAISDF